MRIKKISVRGLFGIFNHPIQLKTEDRITIIHGPNGFGKTFILKMLSGLLEGRYRIFRTISFESFSVEFDTGHTLYVSHPATNDNEAKSKTLLITLSPPEGDPRTCIIEHPSRPDRNDIVHLLERYAPLHRVGPDEFREAKTHEIISTEEAFDRYASILPTRHGIAREEEWLESFRKKTPVRFIQTQRLDAHTEPRHDEQRVPTVKSYSDELKQEIQGAIGRYAKVANELDRTFPERLFRLREEDALPTSEIRKNLLKLDQRRVRLNELGFLDPTHGPTYPPENSLEQNRNALSVYVGDIEKKLNVFDEIESKVGLLTKTINDQFKHKKLSINRDKGFVLTSDTGAHLAPTDLSSGEQHQLVLLYELLFKIKKNSIVLIDEPEISLHIVWQEDFLTNLKSIIDISNFDAIVATHSPQLIGTHWDWTVGLGDVESRRVHEGSTK